jgi:hypothetical protein
MSEIENLYDRPIAGPFQALCGGGTNDGSMEDCLDVAPLQGGGYALKDTKLGDASPVLRFTKAELIAAAQKLADMPA